MRKATVGGTCLFPNRLYYKSVGVYENPTVQTGYNYETVNGYSTGRVSQVAYYTGADTEYAFTYSYDAGGNISELRRDGVLKQRYAYDALGQLVREDNQDENKTTLYTYDKGGNLTRVTEHAYTTGTPGAATKTNTYTYGDSGWKDLLTAYNGQTITYDGIGNPLTYRDGISMTWQRGRQLTTLQKGNTAVSYQYDSDGARVSKTVGGVKTTYTYNGIGQLIEQKSPGKTLWIYYSADGSPELITYNGTNYILRVDAQGNVVNISNQAGTRIVEYSYDAWGNPVRVYDPATGNTITDPAHIANVNPFRYRSYYFDTESGFYFLQSRYYDPTTGRFINADGILGANGDLSAYNLFAYCGNNPVMRSDPTGCIAFSIGLSANFTAIFGISITGVIVFDSYGNIGLQFSHAGTDIKNPSGGLMDTGAGITAGAFWNADTIFDLEGDGVQAGLSGGPGWYVGGDLNWLKDGDYKPDGISIVAGVGVGVDGHVNVPKTEQTVVLRDNRKPNKKDPPIYQPNGPIKKNRSHSSGSRSF